MYSLKKSKHAFLGTGSFWVLHRAFVYLEQCTCLLVKNALLLKIQVLERKEGNVKYHWALKLKLIGFIRALEISEVKQAVAYLLVLHISLMQKIVIEV